MSYTSSTYRFVRFLCCVRGSENCSTLLLCFLTAHFCCLFSENTLLLSVFWQHPSCCLFSDSTLLLPVFCQFLLPFFWEHTSVVCFLTAHFCCLFSESTLLLSVFVLHTLVVCFLTTHFFCLFLYYTLLLFVFWQRTCVVYLLTVMYHMCYDECERELRWENDWRLHKKHCVYKCDSVHICGLPLGVSSFVSSE